MRKGGVESAYVVPHPPYACISYTPLTRLRAGLAMRKGGVKNAGVLRADFSVFFLWGCTKYRPKRVFQTIADNFRTGLVMRGLMLTGWRTTCTGILKIPDRSGLAMRGLMLTGWRSTCRGMMLTEKLAMLNLKGTSALTAKWRITAELLPHSTWWCLSRTGSTPWSWHVA